VLIKFDLVVANINNRTDLIQELLAFEVLDNLSWELLAFEVLDNLKQVASALD